MGDKSPKATHKHGVQKKVKAEAAKQKKKTANAQANSEWQEIKDALRYTTLQATQAEKRLHGPRHRDRLLYSLRFSLRPSQGQWPFSILSHGHERDWD
jgi:hypothetical protein